MIERALHKLNLRCLTVLNWNPSQLLSKTANQDLPRLVNPLLLIPFGDQLAVNFSKLLFTTYCSSTSFPESLGQEYQ